MYATALLVDDHRFLVDGDQKAIVVPCGELDRLQGCGWVEGQELSRDAIKGFNARDFVRGF